MPEKLRFAFASCQHWESGLFTAYEHMAEEDLDLVMHLGDYIYENGGKDGGVRRHAEGEIMSLDDYRNRHAQYKTDPHLQAVHALCPWLVVWDDHEVDNNYAGDISEKEDVTPEQLLIRRANAYQAYYESMPLRRTSIPYGPNMLLYRNVPYGRLVDFAMLDTRQYRSDQPNGDGVKPLSGAALDPRDDDARRHAGAVADEQAAAVHVQLERDGAAGDYRPRRCQARPRAGLQHGQVGQQRRGDQAADVVPGRTQIPNPIVLTGDIHSNWVNDLKVDFDKPDGPTVGTEFVGTSITSGGNGSLTHERTESILAENPFVKFHNLERGYVSCTVTPSEWRSDYRVVEFVDKPGAPFDHARARSSSKAASRARKTRSAIARCYVRRPITPCVAAAPRPARPVPPAPAAGCSARAPGTRCPAGW